jgi:RNA polymerase sigma factor (sigma-70 family)
MDPNSDAELVNSARSGNRQAFGDLVGRYQRQIYGLACILLGDRSEAEDITQEAFLRAWLNFDLLSDPGKFGPWIRRIVFGVSIDWLRAFRPDLFRLADHETELTLFATTARTQSALQAMENIELQQKVWQAISTLPPRYRVPLTMFHMDGLSHRKVAEAIGVTEGSARSLVTRARQRLEPLLFEYAAEVLPALQDVLKEQNLKRDTMLHIVDGESVSGTLRQATVPGEIRIFGDLMYEGPVPAGLDTQSWREIRAQFLVQKLGFTPQDALARLETSSLTLDEASKYEEVILWLDHRLSDQLILIKLLDWFSRSTRKKSKLSLICVGQYPDIPNFVGLGQLTSNQLTSLFDTRLAISDAQVCLASNAWSAFTAPDPTAIERVLREDTSPLPFLAAALRRHLEQFPAADNGLSRTERQTLSTLRARGPLSAIKLYFAVQKTEDPLFMGDLSFFGWLNEMASAPHPLIEIERESPVDFKEGGSSFAQSVIRMTETGILTLEKGLDHIRLNGIDRWLGGVHLTGQAVAWRWDDHHKQLVACTLVDPS